MPVKQRRGKTEFVGSYHSYYTFILQPTMEDVLQTGFSLDFKVNHSRSFRQVGSGELVAGSGVIFRIFLPTPTAELLTFAK